MKIKYNKYATSRNSSIVILGEKFEFNSDLSPKPKEVSELKAKKLLAMSFPEHCKITNKPKPMFVEVIEVKKTKKSKSITTT